MRIRVGTTLVGVCAVTALIAGCNSESDEGKAVPASSSVSDTSAKEPSFDACSIPDDAVRAAGADPATKSADAFGVKLPGWSVCQWQAGPYLLKVNATSHTIAEIKSKDTATDVRPADIPGRTGAFTYQENVRAKGEVCYADFATGDGTTIEVVAQKGDASAPSSEDICAVAVRSAVSLNDYLPK